MCEIPFPECEQFACPSLALIYKDPGPTTITTTATTKPFVPSINCLESLGRQHKFTYSVAYERNLQESSNDI